MDIGQELIEALERQRNDALTKAAIAEARLSAATKQLQQLEGRIKELEAAGKEVGDEAV